MPLLTSLQWVLKCVFTCNHGRTEPKEGKCFCPDCGRGVIFQWVVMRCEDCHHRMESHIALRQLVSNRRCCANCGQHSFYYDYLEAPSYFQLHQAQLIIREEGEYLQGKARWSTFAFAEKWHQFREEALSGNLQSWASQTYALLLPKPAVTPVLIAVQSHAQTANQA